MNGRNAGRPKMILRPLDFSILDELAEGRNVAANLYISLDASRPYVTERLSHLDDYGLVERVGPNENAALFQITEKGRLALENRDQYGEVEDFDDLLDEKSGDE